MNKKKAEELLKKGRADYNLIAGHFSQTRKYLWEDFKYFGDYVKEGDRVLDAGCGNGRLSEIFQKIKVDYIGLDSSSALIRLAKRLYPAEKFVRGEITSLPFAENSFAAVFCLAVFQHLPSKELRLKALKNIYRVLRPGGFFIMINWNLWQGQFRNLRLKYNFKKIFGLNKMDFNDFLKTWKSPAGEILAERYLHAYKLKEIENLLAESGFKVLKNYFSRKGEPAPKTRAFNIITIACKLEKSPE